MFAFILLYFFDLLSLQSQHPLSWSESELTIPGTKVPGNIRSRDQGTFVPRSESSRELLFLGAKVPTGNFRTEERKYRGAKSPDTYQVIHRIHTNSCGLCYHIIDLILLLDITVINIKLGNYYTNLYNNNYIRHLPYFRLLQRNVSSISNNPRSVVQCCR